MAEPVSMGRQRHALPSHSGNFNQTYIISLSILALLAAVWIEHKSSLLVMTTNLHFVYTGFEVRVRVSRPPLINLLTLLLIFNSPLFISLPFIYLLKKGS